MIIQREISELCKRLVVKEAEGQPVFIKMEIGLSIMNVICNKIFGSRFDVGDPEFLEMFRLQAELFRLSTVAARGLVDLFPFLRFILPVSGDVRQLQITNDQWRDILLKKYREHQKTFDKDNLRDYTDVILNARREAEEEDSKDLEYLQDKHLISSITTLFIAGSETAATTLDWAILYLLHFPDIQRRIHAEIDRVIGRNGVVGLDMRKKLPFLEAFICETMRYTTILPLSVPHKTTVNTSLNGYDIPKGTTVIVNIWALHRDPSIWKDPDSFNPGRFLDAEGSFVFPDGDCFLPFGAGPRACMGEVLARCELFLFLANLLQKFTFENPQEVALPSLKHLPGGAVVQPAIEQVCAKTRPVKGYTCTEV
jgi:cytochrome P450